MNFSERQGKPKEKKYYIYIYIVCERQRDRERERERERGREREQVLTHHFTRVYLNEVLHTELVWEETQLPKNKNNEHGKIRN